MTNIDKRLQKEQNHIENMQAPADFEDRVRKALDSTNTRKRRLPHKGFAIAVSLVLFMFIGYHFNTFAFYGKQILGLDEVMSGTLKDLNEAGEGQSIEKSVNLGNNTKLTIHGLMADENRMIVYYSLFNPNGIEDEYHNLFNPQKLTGFLTNAMFSSSQGLLNEDGTELKGMMDFEPPSPFSKELTLHYYQYSEHNEMRKGEITFPYNPAKAMQTEIKQSIKQTVKVDKGKIKFDSLVASPTLTVVKGKVNVDNFDRVNLALHGIELVANGESIPIMGSGNTTSLFGGREFEVRFDALPEHVDTLSIVVKEFVGYEKINQSIPLDSTETTIGNHDLLIKNVSASQEQVEVRIATEEDVMLDDVSIESSEGKVALETTTNQVDSKQKDGRIMKERTLIFKTQTKPETIHIGGMHYMKQYNKSIEVPVD